MLIVVVPLTIWYGTELMWLAWRKSPKLLWRREEIPRAWSRTLLRTVGTKVVLENAEVIDPDRPQILVANHVSWFDVLALAGWVPGKFRFVAKKELEKVPFFGYAWLAGGHISVDRHDHESALESFEVARRRLEEDRPTVIVFPEGTRSRTGELRPFKKGAFVLAIETGIEVVPAAVLGSREIMAKGAWRIRTHRTITVRFGTPIPVEGLQLDDRTELTARAQSAVEDLLATKNTERGD